MYILHNIHSQPSRFRTFLTAFTLILFTNAFMLTYYAYSQSASISGLGEINYRHIGPGAGGDEPTSGFSIEDVMLFVKGSSGDKVDFFSEFIINPKSAEDPVGTAHDQTVAIERFYVSSSAIIPEHTLKAGIFHVFDGTIQSYHSATGNPLPGDLIFYQNPWSGHHGPRSLHDVFHELGVSISGMQLPFMYTASVFNGLGERTPADNEFDNAKLSGAFAKLQYISQQLRGFRAGVSFYYGEGLETRATDDAGNYVGPQVAPVNQYWVGELIYEKPSIKLTGLYLRGVQSRAVTHAMQETFNLSYGAFDHEGEAVVGEVVYKWTDSFSTIGRYQTMWPGDREGTNFIGAGTQLAHGNVERRGALNQVEFGVRYAFTSRFSIKASWQGNFAEENDLLGNIVTGQLVAGF